MLKFLWAQCRNIRVNVFQNKVVYSIPLYGENINAKILSYTVNYDSFSQRLELTTCLDVVGSPTVYLEPTLHHSEESSLHTVKIETVPLDGNDKYSESYPLASHEMK